MGLARLSSHSPIRDLVLAAACAVTAAVSLARLRTVSPSAVVPSTIEWMTLVVVTFTSLTVLAVGLVYGTRCACGADSYGYVSEAVLWTKGTLHIPEPLISVVPWPFAEWTFTPLGYRPAMSRDAIVPTYPPGFPLTMALAIVARRTPSAAFVVVPFLGAASVWLTFLIGKRLDDSITAMCGAVLTACSPIFLYQLIQPMSDVPVTFWWLAALLFVLVETDVTALAGGFAASAGVLTRPNLVPLAVVCAVYAACPGEDPATAAPLKPSRHALGAARRFVLFATGALPGPLLIAWFQNSLYGSPVTSGYGRLSDLYAFDNAGPNARLYAKWLFESHGVTPFIGLMAPLILMASKHSVSARGRRAVWLSLAFIATVYMGYLFYAPFDNWTYTRFLLPAIPLLLLLSVWVTSIALRRIGPTVARLLVTAAVVLVALTWLRGERGLAQVKQGEQRYVRIAEYLRATVPDDALILSMQHSGTVRYYAGRKTVRYDWLSPNWLDPAIEEMRRIRRTPLVLLENWEEKLFRERFNGQAWGALDWPAKVEFDGARLYDPSDRERYLAHEVVRTSRVR
jgi:hypothetical protein